MTKLIVAFRKAPLNYGLRTGSITVLRLKARLMRADLGPITITVLPFEDLTVVFAVPWIGYRLVAG